jgi:hypothetical protein
MPVIVTFSMIHLPQGVVVDPLSFGSVAIGRAVLGNMAHFTYSITHFSADSILCVVILSKVTASL